MQVNLFGNVNGTRYEPPKVNLLDGANKSGGQPVSIKDTSWGKDMPVLKVNISNEGLRALHGDPSMSGAYERLQKTQKELAFWSEHQPIEGLTTRINRMAQEKLAEQTISGQPTIEDKAQNYLDAYAYLYDEISKGYDSGDRIRYIEVNESNLELYPNDKDGFHRLTKEEELGILQDEFNALIERRFGAERQKDSEEVAKALNELQTVKSKMGRTDLKTYEPERIPDRFIERVIKASQMFAADYGNSTGNTIAEIFKNLKFL